MSKMRVHELAKELEKSNKEILAVLKEKKIELTSHMSTIESEQIKLVKEAFLVAEKTEVKPPKAGKKPSNISQVYHPQNSQNNRKSGQGNKSANRNNNQQKVAPKEGANRTETVKLQSQNAENNIKRNANPNNTGDTQLNRASSQKTNENTGSRTVTNNKQAQNNSNQNTQNRSTSNNNTQNRNTSNGNTQNRSNSNSNTQNRSTSNSNTQNKGVSNSNTQNRNTSNSNSRSRNTSSSNTSNNNAPNSNVSHNTTQNRNTSNKNAQNKNQQTANANQGQNRQNQGGNRPNQGGGRRPNQGGNRPNQRRRFGNNQPPAAQAVPVEKVDVIKNIILPEVMTIKELADKMKVPASVVIKKLFLEGTMVTVNHEINYETAEEIALEYNCIAEPEEVIDVIEELLKEDEEDDANLKSRPPVVCVMGHVDHGKTSLLDAIRRTKVTNKEAGGITQHIGAYMVSINNQAITFLDTPGHEAFTSMRMRGANATDIAILVVAADDGVMPQTVEAISHAKAAGIEIIVAVNKIDKPSANLERVKQELSEYELIPEDWGGSTIFVPVSAHTQEGIEQLLEMILLTAEVCELKADPDRKARGLVIEAKLDKGKGAVATILVQKGTLKVGEPIAVGSCFGKVRAMMDDKGRRVKEAKPSVPVEILGLNDVPNAGETFVAPGTEKEARSFAETYISEGKAKLVSETKAKMSLNDLFSQIQAGNLKELGVIIKADVQGSVEAIKQSLLKLSNEEVVVKIIHGGVGAINESDVILASTSNAIIIGFNVRPDVIAKATADHEGVDLRLYKVIYNAIADVESAMKGMLDPIFEEKVLGHAEIRQTFKASGIGTIAGSYILDGMFQRGCSVRIKREGEQIFEGPLASLKRFKDDVKEVKTGYECGLVFEKYNDVQEGDIVEAYTMVEVPR